MPVSLGTTTITALYLGTTSISSAYLGNTQVFGGSFTPLSLFSGGAQGIWLDPSDLTTMFSDRAGTTPVTAPGTVVGLRLDKSKGLALGAELVVNGDFASGTTGWTSWQTGTLSVDTGRLKVENGAATISGGYQLITVVVGKVYQFEGIKEAGTASGPRYYLGTSIGGTQYSSNAAASTKFTATSTTLVVTASTQTTTLGATAFFDNISVRELAGNHAVAPTDAARPIYGVEPKGGRRNLLTYSEDYSNVVWVKSNATPSIAGVDGNGYSITRLASTAINNFHKVQALGATGVTVGAELSGSIILKADGCNWARVGLLDGGGSGYVFINLVTGATGTYVTSGNALTGVTVVSSGTAEWRVTFKRIVQGSAVYFDVGLAKADNDSCFFNGTTADAILIRNTQLETGSTATAYQRVTIAEDVTEAGVPTCHYCRYDGANNSMSTAAIDFTATDKMSVFAGVRKLSDAAAATFLELSPDIDANNGSFGIYPQGTSTSAAYFLGSKGSIAAFPFAAPYNAPISNVVTGLCNIGGDLATLRLDGTQVAQTTTNQGTGNFGNHSLFFGRRNNATLPFSGRDFGIIIVGKAASAGEITDTETWLAARTAQVTL